VSSSLTIEERRYLNQLLAGLVATPASVVLVGSHARGTPRDGSDVDLLIVGGRDVQPARGRFQLILSSEEDLRSRLEQGDDFASWVLRFGKPLQGRSGWNNLRSRLSELDRWPDAELKFKKAARHLRTSKALLELGDEAAAKDEAEIALSHLARGRLLGAGVFPLSRPELGAQLRGIGEDALASALSSTETPVSELVDMLEELLPSD
jgi:predicted nucleotidyltransferase